jgi:hypothetical protein
MNFRRGWRQRHRGRAQLTFVVESQATRRADRWSESGRESCDDTASAARTGTTQRDRTDMAFDKIIRRTIIQARVDGIDSTS